MFSLKTKVDGRSSGEIGYLMRAALSANCGDQIPLSPLTNAETTWKSGKYTEKVMCHSHVIRKEIRKLSETTIS